MVFVAFKNSNYDEMTSFVINLKRIPESADALADKYVFDGAFSRLSTEEEIATEEKITM